MTNTEESKLLAELNLFLDKLTSHYSEPVNKTDQEVADLIKKIEQSTDIGRTFYIVASAISVDYSHCVRAHDYLPVSTNFNANDYIALIHPEYKRDYIQWAVACYAHMAEPDVRAQVKPLTISYRTVVPIKLKDNQYHWTCMEAFPIQFDKNGNMITHLNKFTILYVLDEQNKVPLFNEISNNQFLKRSLNKAVWNTKIMHAFFKPTPSELEILKVYVQYLHFSTADVAKYLNTSIHNIRKHQTNIITKAKSSFFGYHPANTKELVDTLITYKYFESVEQSEEGDQPAT